MTVVNSNNFTSRKNSFFSLLLFQQKKSGENKKVRKTRLGVLSAGPIRMFVLGQWVTCSGRAPRCRRSIRSGRSVFPC